MNSSDSNAALPTWLFIATDVALIGTGAAIAAWSPHPLSTGAMLWVVALVGIGAIAGLVPLVARYERQKNAALDERQEALEALARTVSASAEQISIAAAGFHAIAELAHKNLKSAEQLPHKLQEKIAEFQSQLSAAADADKEEIERELLALRTSESERLESVSQRIAKSSAEWTKLEASTHQNLIAANEAVAKLAMGTAGAIGKAQAAAEQALTQARVEAARALGEASGNATRAIEQARAAALAEFDARISAVVTTLADRVVAELNHRISSPPPASVGAGAPSDDPVPAPAPTSQPAAATPPPADSAPAAPESNAAVTTAAPPKRPRKIRHDPAASGSPQEPATSAPQPPAPPAETPVVQSPPVLADEPLPIPAATIPEIAPVVPNTAEPFSGHIASISNGSTSPAQPPGTPPPAPPADTTKAPRKRASKPAVSDDEPALALELDETPAGSTSGTMERALSSDGATRLLVTAYIGIGNRLYIRGNGAGLSWDKGVPLQFVSIGKWRWETNEAGAPVQFKLYKNDEVECSALGAQSLEPGHQQEVTAAF
jgi:hypothetical protein